MLKTIALGLAALSSPAPSQIANTTDHDIVVTGRANDGYRAVDTDALGIDLTTKELPATVNVITNQFLADSGARTPNRFTSTPNAGLGSSIQA